MDEEPRTVYWAICGVNYRAAGCPYGRTEEGLRRWTAEQSQAAADRWTAAANRRAAAAFHAAGYKYATDPDWPGDSDS